MNNGVLSKFHGVSIWISNLAFINILWLTFTLMGGIFFGFFPSTIAMFFIIKKLFEKNDFNIKKEFTYLFKREFKKSNQLFYPFILCSLILIVDINFISWVHFAYSNLLVILFKILLFLLVMIFLYSLVVYINTTVGKKEIVKKSFMILLNNPMTNIYILTGLLLLYILTLKVVGIFYIFSGSVFTLFLLITVLKTVKKNIFESH